MTRKASDSQLAGIKAYADARNKATIEKVNKAIDRLKRRKKPINFESVGKESGVSRATLYKNAQLKARILSLRSLEKCVILENNMIIRKNKLQLKDDKILSLREKVTKLENDKRNLIAQLVNYEELKMENERLKKEQT